MERYKDTLHALFSSLHGVTFVALVSLFIGIHTVAFVARADLTEPIYGAMPWLDIPAHILFGAALALLLYPTLALRERGALLIIALVLLAGAGWECVEYGYDVLYATPRHLSFANHGIADTLKDMVNNAAGAVVVVCVPGTIWFTKVLRVA